MSYFKIAVVVYTLAVALFVLCGLLTIKKHLGKMPSSMEEIALLGRSATSPWDLFGAQGE